MPLAILQSLRTKDWIKNVIIFAPLIFSGEFFNSEKLLNVFVAIIFFSLLSGAIYIINDIIDIKRDRLHPRKRLRPIASGRLSIKTASFFSIFLCAIIFTYLFLYRPGLVPAFTAYFILQLFYSLVVKEIVILDAVTLALGYVLRIFVGNIAAEARLSLWMVATVFLLGMFIILSKRYQETLLLKNSAQAHRTTLSHYNAGLVQQMLGLFATAIIITYMLYTIAPETVIKFKTDRLFYTNIFVIFGILRYLYHIQSEKLPDNPLDLILKDKFLLSTILLWFLITIFLVYFSP